MDKKEKKGGKDKGDKKAKKEKKDGKDKKSKKDKKRKDDDDLSDEFENPVAKLPVEETQASKTKDKAMEAALFGNLEDEEENKNAPLPVKQPPQDDTEALMEQVEEQVERTKQKESGKKAKKEKKLKKDKKDKNKKDKSARKDKKQQEAAFIDVPSNVVEHPAPEMQIPPAVDKDLEGEDDDIFEKFDLGDNLQFDDSEHFSDRAPSSVQFNVPSPGLVTGSSPGRTRRARSASPSPGSVGKRRRRSATLPAAEEEAEPEPLAAKWAQVMESIKPRRGLVIKDEEAHVFVEGFVKKMEAIAAEDLEDYQQGKPMLKKLKMLPEAREVMEKFQFSDAFIAYGGCKVLAVWLQNLPNGQLPSVHIRSVLLECMERLPITKDALRDAGEPRLGQVVAKLQTHPEETPRNRKRARGLVQRWLRQIMIPEEMDTLEGFLAEGDKVGSIPRPPPETEESLALQEEESAKRLHPAVPVIQGKEYVIQPISTAQPIAREKPAKDTYQGKLDEVLKVMARPNKRSWKPYSVSIAGRQLNAE